jgi:hypothetical protein
VAWHVHCRSGRGVLFAYTVWQWTRGNVVNGWSSTMTAISLFGGVQLIVLGTIGEYLGIVVDEVKCRPLYLLDSIMVNGRSYPIPLKPSLRQWSRRKHFPAEYAIDANSQTVASRGLPGDVVRPLDYLLTDQDRYPQCETSAPPDRAATVPA